MTWWRGLFRLWAVLSFVWMAGVAVVTDAHRNFVVYFDLTGQVNEARREAILSEYLSETRDDTAPTNAKGVEVPDEPLVIGPETRAWLLAEGDPEYRKLTKAKVNQEAARQALLPAGLLALIPVIVLPALAYVVFFAVRWIIRGFHPPGRN